MASNYNISNIIMIKLINKNAIYGNDMKRLIRYVHVHIGRA